MSVLTGIRILVVDDEPDLREMIAEELSASGATTYTASDGVKALAFLKTQAVDVVFTDMRMPGGDGMELLLAIQAELTPKPVRFLCSGFNDHSADDIMKLGVTQVFGKPFDWDQIIAAIQSASKTRRS